MSTNAIRSWLMAVGRRLLFVASGWSDLCPITRLHRSWWKRCRIEASRNR
jgi:hypothetical protein